MKIQLIDSRPGVMNSIVLKEWMRIGLSICLLGLPVILGYFSIQIVEARNAEIAKDSPATAVGGDYDFPGAAAVVHEGAQGERTQNSAVSAPPAASTSTKADWENLGWHQEAPESLAKPGTGDKQAPAVFANYGDRLTRGLLTSVTASSYLSKPFPGLTLHKNGRVIDPASYIHSTIR